MYAMHYTVYKVLPIYGRNAPIYSEHIAFNIYVLYSMPAAGILSP